MAVPGEARECFESIERILCPGGLVLISVCNPLLDVEDLNIQTPYREVKEVPSKFLPGILYREQATGRSINGDIFINSLRTEVVKIQPDGGEQVVERNKHDIPLKLLTREELYTTITKAELRFVREEEATEETIFVVGGPTT